MTKDYPKPQAVHTYIRCFVCGEGGEYILQKRYSQKLNIRCKCFPYRATNILGYDSALSQDKDIMYQSITASGIGNVQAKKVHCTICGRLQRSNDTYSVRNRQCDNPDCPSLGMDWELDDKNHVVVASGIISQVDSYHRSFSK